jgi:hypothetical protein
MYTLSVYLLQNVCGMFRLRSSLGRRFAMAVKHAVLRPPPLQPAILLLRKHGIPVAAAELQLCRALRDMQLVLIKR